jgi:hypothetical protein
MILQVRGKPHKTDDVPDAAKDIGQRNSFLIQGGESVHERL